MAADNLRGCRHTPSERRSRVEARGRARERQSCRSPVAAAACRDRCEADGSVRDVTRDCRFRAEPGCLAEIDQGGLVSPSADGQGKLVVTLRDLCTEVNLRVERAGWVRPPGFRTDVVPLFSKAGCNSGACHGNLNGKGGFRLSLRGDDPAFDLASLTHDANGRRLSVISPGSSLVLAQAVWNSGA